MFAVLDYYGEEPLQNNMVDAIFGREPDSDPKPPRLQGWLWRRWGAFWLIVGFVLIFGLAALVEQYAKGW